MANPRFYSGSSPLAIGPVQLSKSESQHARLSRRLSVGDEVVLFDGVGGQGCGKILDIASQSVMVEVISVTQCEFDAPAKLTLAVSPPKGPRQDVLLEKCTEIGVAAIWPMICQHSIAQPSANRLAKWHRIAIEACKQSQRAWLPEIGRPRTFDQVIAECNQFTSAFIAHYEKVSSDREGAVTKDSVLVLIGPEGGFSDREVATAQAAGLRLLQLGNTILRTETAAIVAAVRLLQV